jgi:hypothetical protein
LGGGGEVTYATTKDLRSLPQFSADGSANVMHEATSEQCDAIDRAYAKMRQRLLERRIASMAADALRSVNVTLGPPRNFADQWREGYERMTRGAV